MGLGILRVVTILPVIRKAVSTVYFIIALILFTFAFLSAVDAFKYYRHRDGKMILGLSDAQRSRISDIISKNVRSSHFVFGAAVSAFLVSITELACTGQVYLPTILYILKVESIRYKAV